MGGRVRNPSLARAPVPEISESFFSEIKTVFENHYIKVPESKIDLYADISEKAEKLEEELSEKADEIRDLKRYKILKKLQLNYLIHKLNA